METTQSPETPAARPFAIGDRVEIVQYRHDFGTDDLPGRIVGELSYGAFTVELDRDAERVRGLGIISIDVAATELRLVTAADELDARVRIVRALGNMPYLPVATHRRVSIREFSLEDVAGTLEDLAAYLADHARRMEDQERELTNLRNDVAAVRRVLGVAS